MRIKLDENVPADLAESLADIGHDVDTVVGEGLRGRLDAIVWDAARAEQRFFITQDLDFSDVRAFQPGSHPGVMVVRLHAPTRRRLLDRVRAVIDSIDIATWAGCLVVVSDHRIRVRRLPDRH